MKFQLIYTRLINNKDICYYVFITNPIKQFSLSPAIKPSEIISKQVFIKAFYRIKH